LINDLTTKQMKLIVRSFAIVFIFQSVFLGGHVQCQTVNTEQGKNYLTAALAYPLFRTFIFGYDRMITENGFIRLNLSRQTLSDKDSYETKYYSMFIQLTDKRKVFTSRSFSVGYGHFLLPKVGFYVAVDLTYRYRFFENKYHYDCVGSDSDSKVSLGSEYRNEYGLQNMAGIKLIIIKYKGICLVADFNLGVGFYWSVQEQLLIAERQGVCVAIDLQYYDTPVETQVGKITGLGIVRAGFGFNF
jgi:hypothetical protein